MMKLVRWERFLKKIWFENLICNVFFTAAVTSAEIKKQIREKNSYKYIGVGGRYSWLADTVSKDKIIESDHFPPKSAWGTFNPSRKLIDWWCSEKDSNKKNFAWQIWQRIGKIGKGRRQNKRRQSCTGLKIWIFHKKSFLYGRIRVSNE